MDVDEVLARGGPPMAEEARLDVRPRERLGQEGVVEQVDLAHRQVIGGAPVGIHLPKQLGLEGRVHGDLLGRDRSLDVDRGSRLTRRVPRGEPPPWPSIPRSERVPAAASIMVVSASYNHVGWPVWADWFFH